LVEHRDFDSPVEIGHAAARIIVEQIERSRADGRPYLLGCPGGRTPKPIFDALGELCDELDIDRSGVIIVMMDDYLESSSDPPTPVPASAHYSCQRFAEIEIRQVINGRAIESKSISKDAIWFPHPSRPEEYDERIASAGGIDLFIVASGASDGHVAFCGPGATLDGITSIVDLAPSTRVDNLATFPDFASEDEVPTRGISVGLGTIRQQSKSIMMVLHGSDKAESLRRIESALRYDPAWPATFIIEADNGSIWSDAAARLNGKGRM
jgi:glucosamine-6-phosphate deaminase